MYDLLQVVSIIKELPHVATFLTSLFNTILRTSSFPTQWKFVQIAIILKPRNDPTDVASYTSINILKFSES